MKNTTITKVKIKKTNNILIEYSIGDNEFPKLTNKCENTSSVNICKIIITFLIKQNIFKISKHLSFTSSKLRNCIDEITMKHKQSPFHISKSAVYTALDEMGFIIKPSISKDGVISDTFALTNLYCDFNSIENKLKYVNFWYEYNNNDEYEIINIKEDIEEEFADA